MSRFSRVQDAARQSVDAARHGAEAASGAAERFVPMANEQIMIIRSRSAPRLRRAARYVEHEMAPRVSGMLSDAARRVEPPRRSVISRGALMAMLGAVAAAGAAGVAATRRDSIRAMTKGTGEHVEGATSADSMTVSGADVDGQVHTPH